MVRCVTQSVANSAWLECPGSCASVIAAFKVRHGHYQSYSFYAHLQIKFVEDTTNCSFENVTYRETLKGGPEVPIVLAVANNKVRRHFLVFFVGHCLRFHSCMLVVWKSVLHVFIHYQT